MRAFLHKSEHYPHSLWQVNKQSSSEGIEESGGGKGGFPTCQLCVVPLIKHSEIKLLLRQRGAAVCGKLDRDACSGHIQKLVIGL